MQIDGHHAGTYVAARLAGFNHDEATTISYAAQYVDDATNEGAIRFSDNPYMYARMASAHSMIDYNNFVDVQNHLAWLPFHFLPGNESLPAGESPAGGEVGKLMCRPDSPIARDMLRMAFKDRGKSRELHRLGIAMHVYADTFAHQGFIGALSEGNRVANMASGDPNTDKRILRFTKVDFVTGMFRSGKAFATMIAKSIRMAIQERESLGKFWKDFRKGDPLGHAAADTFPDQPYLIWHYQDWRGGVINRDNPAIFFQAFNMMSKAMQAWRVGDGSMDLSKYPNLNAIDAAAIGKLIHEVTDPDGEVRHKLWCEAIAKGVFSFGPAVLEYTPKGLGSWKEIALGTTKTEDTGLEMYPYSSEFLGRDWKLFHDALWAHRIDVVHEILPRYGICAA